MVAVNSAKRSRTSALRRVERLDAERYSVHWWKQHWVCVPAADSGTARLPRARPAQLPQHQLESGSGRYLCVWQAESWVTDEQQYREPSSVVADRDGGTAARSP